MSLAPDNVVRRIVTDAELLLWAVAEADLPAGLRIIDIGLAPVAGVAICSGHRLAAAHRLRAGTIAVGVAARALVGEALALCPDEAQLVVEAVTAHELAHALVADIEGEAGEATLAVLRDLPALLADAVPTLSAPARMARDHCPRWAGALVALGQRCAGIRRLSRSAWASVIEADLRAHGIDAEAVADALGHVPPDAGLRELLAEGGPVAERLALAVPGLGERITAIGIHRSTPAEPGHVAPVGGGGFEEVSNMFLDVLDKVRGRQAARAAGIEELARRMAAGEKVQADEVEAVLTRTGCTVDELRERVACLERRAEQHRAILAGEKAEKRLAKIRAEINDARVVAVDAIDKAEAVAQRLWGETIALEQAARDAFQAKEMLLAPVNLTVKQREQLAQAKQACGDAERALTEAQASMPTIRASITKLEAGVAEDENDCRLNPDNGDMRERLNRHKAAADTKRRELNEIEGGVPGLQAATDKARESLRTIEAELMR